MNRPRLNGEDPWQWPDTHTVSFGNGCYAWCKDGAVLAGETRTWPRTTTQPPNSLPDPENIGSLLPIPLHPLAIAAPVQDSENLEIESVVALLPTAAGLASQLNGSGTDRGRGARSRLARSGRLRCRNLGIGGLGRIAVDRDCSLSRAQRNALAHYGQFVGSIARHRLNHWLAIDDDTSGWPHADYDRLVVCNEQRALAMRQRKKTLRGK